MSEYRIVRADGTPIPNWDAFDSLAEARCYVPRKGEYAPYRVQRVVWEDVPEPEPLPDLPTQAWCYFDPSEPDAEVWFFDLPVVDADDRRVFLDGGLRVFRGTVTEWVEVTE